MKKANKKRTKIGYQPNNNSPYYTNSVPNVYLGHHSFYIKSHKYDKISNYGAGEGNRTLVLTLARSYSTIKLHLQTMELYHINFRISNRIKNRLSKIESTRLMFDMH